MTDPIRDALREACDALITATVAGLPPVERVAAAVAAFNQRLYALGRARGIVETPLGTIYTEDCARLATAIERAAREGE